MVKTKVLALGLVFAVLFSGSAFAIYNGGFRMSGNVYVSAGSVPSDVIDTWDISISDDAWHYHNSTYINNGSAINLTMGVNDFNISSSDANCTYESQKDLKFQVSNDLVNYYNMFDNPILEMQDGNNTISTRVKRHPNSCPLEGSYNITGSI